MIKHRTVEIPARIVQEVDTIICDLCGKDAGGGGWEEGQFDIEETEVTYRSGSSYPEGGSAVDIEFHVCPPCFTGKLVPWMESQGAKATRTESDW